MFPPSPTHPPPKLIAAFIIASTATQKEMLNWYREHVVWIDSSLNLKLLRNGILMRIYAPMVIVQGLSDSGLLGSVIASAQTLPFLASIENTNSSRVAASASLMSRKIGRNQESRVTAGPPLSPGHGQQT